MNRLAAAHSRGFRHRRPLILACALIGLLLGPPASRGGGPRDLRDSPADTARWNALAESYAALHFAQNPTDATEAGVHRHDFELERLDPATIAADQRDLDRMLDRLSRIDPRRLPPRLSLDARYLLARVHGERAQITEDRFFEHNPGLYVHLAGGSVDALLKRSFAPLCDRLRAAAARAGQVPRLLMEARSNLRHPPRLWTQMALSDLTGAIDFYDTVVQKAALSCPDAAVRDELSRAAGKARAALRDFGTFLKDDLLPRSDGSYALGPRRFAELLHDEERAELDRLRAEFVAVARKIDPHKTPAQVLAEINKIHPTAERLLPEAREQVTGIRRFVAERDIVPIPPGEDLHIEETPLFYRQTSFASMSTPGPFEDKAREAYFYVTPVEPGWPETRKEEHLRAFDRFSMENTIIHEAYPGHYVQGLYAQHAPTLVRRLVSSTAYVEGWALYCERMLLDAGFDPDPRERLIMLQWALLRAVRYVGSIEMHARGMSFDGVVQMLKENAYLDQSNAEREAMRYTEDHTVLAYTYGDLTLSALRDKAARAEGKGFRLGEFHRRLLAEGPLPMALLEEALSDRP
jgi:uncharacterized protein (DUF885 family)